MLVCFGGKARSLIQKLDPDYLKSQSHCTFPVLLSSLYDTHAHHYGVAAAASAAAVAVGVGATGAAAAAVAVAVAITVAWGVVGGVRAAVAVGVGVRGVRWLDQILGRCWCFKALNLMVYIYSILYLYQQDWTSAGICPWTGRVGAHANTHIIHIALILILILTLTLILILFIILVILLIPSSYASSPHHTHHPLSVLIIPSSYSSYSSYASYSLNSSSSSSPSSWDVGHFSMKRIICFSLRGAAEPGRRGPCLWRASTFHRFLRMNTWMENVPCQ